MTAEEFYKTMWNPLYEGTNHKQFNYHELIEFAKEYASQSKELSECKEFADSRIKLTSDLNKQLADAHQELSELKSSNVGKLSIANTELGMKILKLNDELKELREENRKLKEENVRE